MVTVFLMLSAQKKRNSIDSLQADAPTPVNICVPETQNVPIIEQSMVLAKAEPVVSVPSEIVPIPSIPVTNVTTATSRLDLLQKLFGVMMLEWLCVFVVDLSLHSDVLTMKN